MSLHMEEELTWVPGRDRPAPDAAPCDWKSDQYHQSKFALNLLSSDNILLVHYLLWKHISNA